MRSMSSPVTSWRRCWRWAWRVPLAWFRRADPLTNRVVVDREGHRDARVTMEFDVVQEPTASLLPHFCQWVPSPAGHVLNSPLAISVKPAFGVKRALRTDPGTEWVTIDDVGLRNVGVTVEFDVVLEPANTFLPTRRSNLLRMHCGRQKRRTCL
jgi:hypothetical protein